MCNTRSNGLEEVKKQHALMNHWLRNMIQFASTKMLNNQHR